MTNGAKYESEIIKILKSDKMNICDDFIIKKVLPSYGIKCTNRCAECKTLFNIWLNKEKPKIDMVRFKK